MYGKNRARGVVAGLSLAAVMVVSVLVTAGPSGMERSLSLASADRPAPVELSSVTKTPSASHFSSAGQWIQYTVTVVNSGNAPAMQPITVTDSRTDASGTRPACTIDQIPAHGASGACVIDYQVTAADVAAGSVTDTVTAVYHQGDGESERTVTSAPVTVTRQDGPEIGLATSAQPRAFSAAGQPVTYTYTVANDGDSDLTGVHVSDTVEGRAVPVTCDGNQLDTDSPPLTCQASYDVTQADLTRGTITNDATATGTALVNDQPVRVSHSASDTITRDDQPSVGVAATASASSFAQAGTEISYVYDVTNTGNTPLTGLSVSDSLGTRVSCAGVTALAPGASARCLAAYRTTAADLAAGHVSSTVTARGRTAAGREVAGTAALRIPASRAPGLSILKTASPASFGRAGDRIAYYYQVTNTGTVPVTGVTVTDSRLRDLSCPLTALAPGTHMVCTAAGVVTAADVARGSLANVARVTGTAGGRELARSTMAIVPASRIESRVSPFLRTVPVTG